MARKRNPKTTKKDGILHSYRKAIDVCGTIFVSLPKEYCQTHNVKRGDTMALTANSIISMVKKND